MINMNEIVGKDDILFLSLDTLRYDVAYEEYLAGNLPNLCRNDGWEKRHAPGTFTYPAHHSIFAGFFPTSSDYTPSHEREWLFLNKKMARTILKGKDSFMYEGNNFVEGLAKVGYKTICIGGVIFFSKIEGVCSVFPDMFEESYWHPKFGVTNPKSAEEQVSFAIKLLEEIDKEQRVFLFINFSAMHGPNYYYLDKYQSKESNHNSNKNSMASKLDSIESQKAALRYVDKSLETLFKHMKKRNRTFCIALSDHGTCYGEDGYRGHNLPHEKVWTVPYKRFFL